MLSAFMTAVEKELGASAAPISKRKSHKVKKKKKKDRASRRGPPPVGAVLAS